MASRPCDSWFIPPWPPWVFLSPRSPLGWSKLYFSSDTSSVPPRLSRHFSPSIFRLFLFKLQRSSVFCSLPFGLSREAAAVCSSSTKPPQQGQPFVLNCVDHQNQHDLTLPCSTSSLRPICPALPALWCKDLSCSASRMVRAVGADRFH